MGRSEALLWCITAAWLLASPFIYDTETLLTADILPKDLALLAGLFLLDGFITACVYAALKDLVVTGAWRSRDFLLNGAHFFGRLMMYKINAAFLAMLLVSIALGITGAVNSLSLAVTGVVFTAALAWIALPLFFLALTLYAPLIILVDDVFLYPAMRQSYRFVREHLPYLVVLVFVFGLLWAFANFGERLYNMPQRFVLVEKTGKAIALSYLEIVTIKAFLFYYCTNRTNDGKLPE